MSVKIIPMSQLSQEVDNIGRNINTKFRGVSISAPRKAGRFMIELARRFAPVATGHLRSNIRGRSVGKGYQVISTVNDEFKYNLWVDKRPGVTSYGKRYGTHNQRSGIAGGGFFTKSVQQTRKRFKNVLVKDISNLKGKLI